MKKEPAIAGETNITRSVMLCRHHNPQAQRKATFDYDLPLRRLMHRTTVRGSVPF
jgi:hypothetical protein